MGPQKRGTYTVKTYYNQLYTWSPDTTVNKANVGKNNTNNFCSATPFSQGQDWICTYVYNIVVVDGMQQRSAYVACDYVQ